MEKTCKCFINTAENIAKQWSLSKEEQDQFSVSSQNKCEAAQNSGEFNDEIVPVQVKQRRGTHQYSFIGFSINK